MQNHLPSPVSQHSLSGLDLASTSMRYLSKKGKARRLGVRSETLVVQNLQDGEKLSFAADEETYTAGPIMRVWLTSTSMSATQLVTSKKGVRRLPPEVWRDLLLGLRYDELAGNALCTVCYYCSINRAAYCCRLGGLFKDFALPPDAAHSPYPLRGFQMNAIIEASLSSDNIPSKYCTTVRTSKTY